MELKIILGAFIFNGLGIACLVQAYRHYRYTGYSAATPIKKIHSLTKGFVRIKAVTKPIKLLSPAGIECIAHIEEGHFDAPTLFHSTPFYAKDATGEILVLPDKAILELAPKEFPGLRGHTLKLKLLEANTQVYIAGMLKSKRTKDGKISRVIQHDPKGRYPFFISTFSMPKFQTKLYSSITMNIVAGAVCFFMGMTLLYMAITGQERLG